MPRDCPTCGNAITGDGCRSCGWAEVRPGKSSAMPFDGRCCWTSFGERCRYGGSVSKGTKGSAEWFCHAHAFCDVMEEGERIVRKSAEVLTVDYSLEARRAAAVKRWDTAA